MTSTPRRRLRLAAALGAFLPLTLFVAPDAPVLAATSVTSVTSTVVQGEALDLPSSTGAVFDDSSASALRALQLWSNTTASGSVTLPGRAPWLVLTARGDQCVGAPLAEVLLDGTRVGRISVSATRWTTYRLTGSWAAGHHSVAVRFPNDLGTRTCNRNLHIDSLTFNIDPASVTPASDSADTSPSAGAWNWRQTSGRTTVVDSLGQVWAPATGLQGGAQVPVWGGIAGSASEQLYRSAQQGAQSWTVPVPGPGRYAVDLLVSDASGVKAGERVFDVTATDGSGTSHALASGLDLVAQTRGWWAHHVTGIVPVTRGDLTLRFSARKGQTLINALSVTSMGAPGPTWTDTFDGAAGGQPSSVWVPRVGSGPFGDGELQAYTDRNSRLDGSGSLELTARKETWSDRWGTRDYSSARLETKGRKTFTYGTVEARMQVPAGQGLWPAFWSLGSDIDSVDWPRSGELDVMEVLGSQPTTVFGHLHGLGDGQDARGWQDQPVSNVGRGYDVGTPLANGWHTYAMEVTPRYVSFSIDGRTYFTATPFDMRASQQWPVGKPYYLVLNLAVGGGWGGPPDASTRFPASLRVDYVTLKG